MNHRRRIRPNNLKHWLSAMFTAACLAMMPGISSGFSSILSNWQSTYPASQSDDELTAAVGAACMICHQGTFGGSTFNTYGQDVRANASGGDWVGAFLAIEGMDSDGEGNSNLTEIDANVQPGWCEPAAPGCVNAGTPPPVPLDPAAGPVPPVADAGGPYVGVEGSPIAFDGTASNDPDGSIVAYDWDFGDGSAGTGPAPSHTYVSAGTYTVTLTVTDNDGLTDNDVTSADVSPVGQPVPPIADAGGPYGGTVGSPVNFDGGASQDPDGNIVSYAWDFGDGGTGSGVTPSHTYNATGTYTVTLTVTDNDGLTDSNSTTATINDQNDGTQLYINWCSSCHGHPFRGHPLDPNLPGVKRVFGARTCSIEGSIYGTAVFPGGVPDMQFLQGLLSDDDILAISNFLNSGNVNFDGERRYLTACAGCHGNDGRGGRTGKGVLGSSAREIQDAIEQESDMQFLGCMPMMPDIQQIGDALESRGGGCGNDCGDD